MDWESLIWNTDLAWARKFVMLAISRRANATGRANISAIEIAASTGLARRTVHEQIAVAIAHGQLQRIAPSLFQISLTQSDSRNGVARTSAYLGSAPRAHDVRHAHTTITAPYKERTSEDPFGVSSFKSGSMSLSSSVSDKDKELTQESGTETPAWILNLRESPDYNLTTEQEYRLLHRVVKASISSQRLIETSTAIAAKWETIRWSPSNKRGYKRLDLTFFAWALREGFTNGKSQNSLSPNQTGERGAFADADRYRRAAAEQEARGGGMLKLS